MRPLSVTVSSLGVWLAGLSLLGCSSSNAGPAGTGGTQTSSAGSGAGAISAGAASGGTSGGGSANAGGASAGAGGFTWGDSKTEACIAYVLAVCGRQSECSGSPGDCLRVSASCPDLAFSAGATRTVESLQACAEAYKTWPCEQMVLGILPDCVTAGTVALSAPCLFPSQCASLSCARGTPCGTCVPSAALGESCADGQLCDGRLVCQDGTCQRPTVGAPTAGDVGAACSNANAMFCRSGLRCDAATSTCVPYPTLGMSCADARSCGAGSYCELGGLSCQAFPGEGAPCGVDAFTGEAAYCKNPLRCARSSKGGGVCVQLPAAGQPCLTNPDTLMPEAVACDSAARCDAAQSPALCAPKASQSQHCAANADCGQGLSCICPDGQTSCDVTAPICGHLRFKGQPCTAPGDACHPGFTCTAGVCEPRDSQGLFAAACQ